MAVLFLLRLREGVGELLTKSGVVLSANLFPDLQDSKFYVNLDHSQFWEFHSRS